MLTGLSNCDDIVSSEYSRDAVRLDRCRVLILAQLNVLAHDGVKTSIVKLR